MSSEKAMAPHSSTLAWKIPWTEESGRLQSMRSLRVGHDWLHFDFSFSCIGEGNGNPLQCSCLENPRDGGAWWAAVCGVAQSRIRLKWLSSSNLWASWAWRPSHSALTTWYVMQFLKCSWNLYLLNKLKNFMSKWIGWFIWINDDPNYRKYILFQAKLKTRHAVISNIFTIHSLPRRESHGYCCFLSSTPLILPEVLSFLPSLKPRLYRFHLPLLSPNPFSLIQDMNYLNNLLALPSLLSLLQFIIK